MTKHSLIRQKLIAHNAHQKEVETDFTIPVTGRIEPKEVARVQDLALRAHAGDTRARDQLFLTLCDRLYGIGVFLKPWPNSPIRVGIWDRGDVCQESWIIFAELLEKWDGETSFVAYLLARFGFRLRDRILRGIGKRQSQLGTVHVSQELLGVGRVADDFDQPEPMVMALWLVEERIQQRMAEQSESKEIEPWQIVIMKEHAAALVSPGQPGMITDCDVRKRIA